MPRFKKGSSGNPGGRPRKQPRQDGFQNSASGFGSARDKRVLTTYQADYVTDAEARELWRGNDVAASAIESYPQDAMRGGYDVTVGDDKELGASVKDAMRDLDADLAVARALEYERAYGGAALFPVVNDGSPDLSEPLMTDRCQDLECLILLEPRELTPARWWDGSVEVWRMSKFVVGGAPPPPLFIHASRLIIFPGIRVSQRPVVGPLYGWGDSVLTRMREVLNDFGISWAAAGAIVHDFSQGVYKMKNYAALMAAGKDKQVLDQMANMDMNRSVMRMMLIDAEDEFTRTTTPVSGLADLLDRFASRLAAAVKMPVTKLMGISPAGMNATGESDSRNWYDQVAAFQVDKCASPVERIAEILFCCKDGPTGGEEPDSWCVDWHKLWEPTAEEEAKTRLAVAQADQIYASIGWVSPDEGSRSRWGGGTYSADMHVDFDARAVMAPPPPPPGSPEEAALRDPAAPLGPPAGAAPELEDDDEGQPPTDESVPAGETRSEGWVGVGEVRAGQPERPVKVRQHTRGGKVITPHARAVPVRKRGETPAAYAERVDAWARAERLDFVEERGGKWVVLDKTRTEVLGTHDTEAEADAQLAAIEAAKARRDRR